MGEKKRGLLEEVCTSLSILLLVCLLLYGRLFISVGWVSALSCGLVRVGGAIEGYIPYLPCTEKSVENPHQRYGFTAMSNLWGGLWTDMHYLCQQCLGVSVCSALCLSADGETKDIPVLAI